MEQIEANTTKAQSLDAVVKPFNVGLHVYLHSVDAASAEAASKLVQEWFYRVADCGFGLPGIAAPVAWVSNVEEKR